MLRDSVVGYTGRARIPASLQDDASEVRNGMECGIGVKNYTDVKVGDQIEVFEVKDRSLLAAAGAERWQRNTAVPSGCWITSNASWRPDPARSARPQVGMVSITGVNVSRDLGHARIYVTVLGCDTAEEAGDSLEALNKAAGFLRSQLSWDSSMRSVPQLRFYLTAAWARVVTWET